MPDLYLSGKGSRSSDHDLIPYRLVLLLFFPVESVISKTNDLFIQPLTFKGKSPSKP